MDHLALNCHGNGAVTEAVGVWDVQLVGKSTITGRVASSGLLDEVSHEFECFLRASTILTKPPKLEHLQCVLQGKLWEDDCHYPYSSVHYIVLVCMCVHVYMYVCAHVFLCVHQYGTYVLCFPFFSFRTVRGPACH